MRTVKLSVLALATAWLAAGAWTAQGGLRTLAFERQQTQAVQAAVSQARQLLPEIERREQQAQALDAAIAEVDHLGFEPSQWNERRIRRAATPASRQEAARLLAELGSGSLFVADAFELAVLTKDSGLFHVPRSGDQGVTLGYSGAVHFKTGASAPHQP